MCKAIKEHCEQTDTILRFNTILDTQNSFLYFLNETFASSQSMYGFENTLSNFSFVDWLHSNSTVHEDVV